MSPEERKEREARNLRADYQIRRLRELATRRPGARERLEGMQD
jgi:hypothetical protein